MAVKKKVTPVKKAVKTSPSIKKVAIGGGNTDEEKVLLYMNSLKHPLKSEMEAVRNIIKKADARINERIKWNAPSYYYKDDMVTFNAWAKDNVHLVFHHPFIVKIKSPSLEGDYDSRRMMYFNDMKEVKKKKSELQRIIRELIKMIDKKK